MRGRRRCSYFSARPVRGPSTPCTGSSIPLKLHSSAEAEQTLSPADHRAQLVMKKTLRFLGQIWNDIFYSQIAVNKPTFPSWEWAEGAPVAQGVCALSVTALAVASWVLYMKYGIFTHPGNATIKQGTGAVYDWASCWLQLNLLFPIRFNVRIKWMLPEIWRRIICQ